MYSLKIIPGAERDIEKLRKRIPLRDFEHLYGAIENLATQPRPHDVKKLKGAEGVYRTRVGNYRIVYKVLDDEQMVLIVEVARRTETTYRA
ncbi:MAG: type II toxin-antitoxin system RelE/ParE family toxin [Chloroflexi bacterium]|nr:type II toxin-antitoxin system RelE/ParE family toxin [Chloroflexota bacterium]